jgi:hypothetical protein
MLCAAYKSAICFNSSVKICQQIFCWNNFSLEEETFFTIQIGGKYVTEQKTFVATAWQKFFEIENENLIGVSINWILNFIIKKQ